MIILDNTGVPKCNHKIPNKREADEDFIHTGSSHVKTKQRFEDNDL